LSWYTSLVRPALFALDPERAHDLTMTVLRRGWTHAFLPPAPRDRRLEQDVLGLRFHNPLGLGAGLDKQGAALAAWGALGFGFAEVGTVTPRPQPGNPRPRLFRLPGDLAVINRFGFNSDGAERVARNLAAGAPAALRVGINIGKNKDTPNEQAADDYVQAIDALHPFADYFVVNVSSPNTAGLRALQGAQTLRPLIEQVVDRVRRVAPRAIPVLVKLSPDMSDDELRQSADATLEAGAAGIVATNTTTMREGLLAAASVQGEAGGLSGAPLRARANAACRLLYRHCGGRVPIVGVGGIAGPDHAYERIRSGATLVQVYTALVYEGPQLAGRIIAGLAERLSRDGFSSMREAIGIDVH
jgi:dihydroorotate dehydrogenase